MNKDVASYNKAQDSAHQDICDLLAKEIDKGLPKSENKIWHGHPVWFLDGNPIVGYSPRKEGSINLMFWSGQSFDEPGLQPEGSFKAAEVRYTDPGQINTNELQNWLKKARDIQWDYKNIVKRKSHLQRLA